MCRTRPSSARRKQAAALPVQLGGDPNKVCVCLFLPASTCLLGVSTFLLPEATASFSTTCAMPMSHVRLLPALFPAVYFSLCTLGAGKDGQPASVPAAAGAPASTSTATPTPSLSSAAAPGTSSGSSSGTADSAAASTDSGGKGKGKGKGACACPT